jgi:dihydrofolate reductase
MGRKTWESLPIKPLPNRRNIVITRSSIEEIDCFRSIDDALQTCDGDVWFIGGAGIYEEAMKKADLIDMTLVPDNITGKNCIYFPKIGNEWKEGENNRLEEDPKLGHKTYTRRV